MFPFERGSSPKPKRSYMNYSLVLGIFISILALVVSIHLGEKII
jgi:hypothetical protein